MTHSRRNLFKTLAGAACAAAIQLTGKTPAVPSLKPKINPMWLTAPYEDAFLWNRDQGRVAAIMVREKLPDSLTHFTCFK